ncbi:MAG: putative metal-binding motif-containing protein [Deltaproteobacteria bacterium]|nr:putative metal-binding motif-containing protein [Deltaproteobacteria bacterium]
MVRHRVLWASCLFAIAGACGGSSSPADAVDATGDNGSDDGGTVIRDALAEVDAEVGPDITGEPGTFGAPCETSEDCFSGFCRPSRDGFVCSLGCSGACPAAWTCEAIADGGGNPAFVCVDPYAYLCLPCLENRDCNQGLGTTTAQCLDQGGEGSFCGVACSEQSPCPTGYSCQTATTTSGTSSTQCVPDDGMCECGPLAVALGARTSCRLDNEFGSCPGARGCTLEGLGACDAPVAAAEVCNGADDDCDGYTDEETGGGLCDVETGAGKCPGVLACKAGNEICVGIEPTSESCNGVDDDCDGTTDEGFSDHDEDGKANCVDIDDDNDGSFDDEDCAPFDASVYPLADELCNSKDENCNGQIDEDGAEGCVDYWQDVDKDGQGADTVAPRCLCAPDAAAFFIASAGGDCDDKNAFVKTGAVEGCNARDDDCDGMTDEGFPDTDGDGQADCLEMDTDGDGAPDNLDCAPLDADIFPGKAEVCDGKDQDCDGLTDEQDATGCKNYLQDKDGDGQGALTVAARCLCAPDVAASFTVQVGGDCDDLDKTVYAGATEVCDGKDNDCDAFTDEGSLNTDGDAKADCVDSDDDDDGTPDDADCKPLDPTVHPGMVEACNGKDDDCDGQTDEPGATGCDEYWRDFDGDEYGAKDEPTSCLCAPDPATFFTATQGGDCDDVAAGTRPEVFETCNGVDDNCDGATDEGALSPCNDCAAVCYLQVGPSDDIDFTVNAGSSENVVVDASGHLALADGQSSGYYRQLLVGWPSGDARWDRLLVTATDTKTGESWVTVRYRTGGSPADLTSASWQSAPGQYPPAFFPLHLGVYGFYLEIELQLWRVGAVAGPRVQRLGVLAWED